MKKHPDRDFEIALAFANGEDISKLANAYQLRPVRIRAIAKENAGMVTQRAGRAVPNGLSVRAAIAIESALGIWPSDEKRHIIVERRWEILRSWFGRRMIIEDIDRWLEHSDPEIVEQG